MVCLLVQKPDVNKENRFRIEDIYAILGGKYDTKVLYRGIHFKTPCPDGSSVRPDNCHRFVAFRRRVYLCEMGVDYA